MADGDRAMFVAGLERAVADVYRAAMERGNLSADALDTVLVLTQHHDEHAVALAAIAGRPQSEIRRNDTLYAELNQTVLGAEPLPAILAAEQSLAATHLASMATLTSTDAAAAVAAILPVEAQHVVVVGAATGLAIDSPALLPPLEPLDAALDEGRYA